MKINVTEEDIRMGLRYECSKCPIAIALKRAYKEERVAVSTVAFLIYHLSIPLHTLDDDSNIVSFIEDFDNGRPVKPFSFEIKT